MKRMDCVFKLLFTLLMTSFVTGAKMYDPVFDYFVNFHVKGPLGISFSPHSSGGAEIKELVPNGAAAISKKIEMGDYLLSINGVDVSSLDQRAIMKILSASSWPRQFEFRARNPWSRDSLGKEEKIEETKDEDDEEAIGQGLLTILSPSILGGTYKTQHAAFGANPSCATHKIVLAVESEACNALKNADEVKGNFVIIERGTCTFYHKAHYAMQAGAVGVLVVNISNDDLITMPAGPFDVSGITIPVVMISKSDGSVLRQVGSQTELTATLGNAESRKKCNPGSVEIGADGQVIVVEKEIPIEEIITNRRGKRCNPGKPGKCELHLWSPTQGIKVLTNCVTAAYGPMMPKQATPIAFGGMGCDTWMANPLGKIVVATRGVCQFGAKALLAEQNGSVALVVINKGKGTFRMAVGDPEPDIASAMISEEDGELLKEWLSDGKLWIGRLIPKGYQ